jgi:hypothetical protein
LRNYPIIQMETGRVKKILILAYTGFIIRNFILGNFLKEFLRLNSYVEVLIAVPNPNDKKLKGFINQFSGKVELVKFLANSHKRKNSFTRNLDLHNFYYYTKMYQKQSSSVSLQKLIWEGHSKGNDRRFKDLSQKLSWGIYKLGLFNLLEKVYLNNWTQSEISKKWLHFLSKEKPDFVLSTMLTHAPRYSCSSDLPVVLMANKLKIPVGTYVQSWDNLSSKVSVLPDTLSKVWTWSDRMNEEVRRFYPKLSNEKISVIGGIQFDHHLDKELIVKRETFCKSQGLDTNKPYVLMATGTVKWMPNEPMKMVQLISRMHHLNPDIQFLIRLHPKDHGQRWEKYRERLDALKARIQFTHPEQEYMDRGGFQPPKEFYRDQVNAIYHSAVVINSSSTMTVDAAILDRPVICIAYDVKQHKGFPEGRALAFTKSEHYKILTRTGGVSLALTEDHCLSLIEDYIAEPDLNLEGRKRIVVEVCNKADGQAGTRLAREVDMQLKSP